MAKVYIVCSADKKAFDKEDAGVGWTDCLIEKVYAYRHMAEAQCKYFLEKDAPLGFPPNAYWVEEYEVEDAF